jgi:8-amino-7-oxononanoate synthase
MARERIQTHAHLFYETLTSHPLWKRTQETLVIRVPLAQGWKERPLFTHIVTVSTRPKHTYWLFVHLMAASFSVFPVPCPIVPLGQDRLRIILHAENTEEQIVGLVNALFTWAEEIIAIEEGETEETESSVVKRVNEWIRKEGLKGTF